MSLSKKEKKENEIKVVMISALFAGSTAKFITHPIDTVKAKLQVNYKKNLTITVREMVKVITLNEGIAGFYKGLPVSLIGSLPGSVLYFGSYEFAKKNIIEKKLTDYNFLNYFISGMFAETIACLVFVPVDIIKERRQVQSNIKTFEYKNDLDALVQIIRKEGVRGIYKAYGATLASFGPLSATQFTIFEKMKGLFVSNDNTAYLKRIKKENKDLVKKELTFLESMFCSSISSGLASIITNPLDLVKMRMQVQRAGSNYTAENAEYKNIIQGLGVVLRNEGFNGLFKGSIARALYFIPMGSLTMTFVEIMKPVVRNMM